MQGHHALLITRGPGLAVQDVARCSNPSLATAGRAGGSCHYQHDALAILRKKTPKPHIPGLGHACRKGPAPAPTTPPSTAGKLWRLKRPPRQVWSLMGCEGQSGHRGLQEGLGLIDLPKGGGSGGDQGCTRRAVHGAASQAPLWFLMSQRDQILPFTQKKRLICNHSRLHLTAHNLMAFKK